MVTRDVSRAMPWAEVTLEGAAQTYDHRMGKALTIAGWVSLVAAVSIVAVIGAVTVTHPRDEAAYLRYVHRYGDYHGKPASDQVPVEHLIAAGDRACDWLARQPMALWRTGPHFRFPALMAGYQAEMSQRDRALPRATLAGAWEYLCPATKELRKPHYVLTSPPGDD